MVPSDAIGAVPETQIICPIRQARENPIDFSKGEPELTILRDMVFSKSVEHIYDRLYCSKLSSRVSPLRSLSLEIDPSKHKSLANNPSSARWGIAFSRLGIYATHAWGDTRLGFLVC